MLGVLSALVVVLMFLFDFPYCPSFRLWNMIRRCGGINCRIFVWSRGRAYRNYHRRFNQGMTVSADRLGGIAMHIIASGSYVFVASFVYKKIHTRKGALIALIVSSLCMTLVMIPANLFFTVKFWGFPKQQVVDLLLPGIIPFNLIKAVINSVTTFLIYKPISRMFDIINARNR